MAVMVLRCCGLGSVDIAIYAGACRNGAWLQALIRDLFPKELEESASITNFVEQAFLCIRYLESSRNWRRP